jgi:L-lysine 2,3-aminomutase
MSDSTTRKRVFRAIGRRELSGLPQLAGLDRELVRSMEVIASVLPFRVNHYVVDELIDWRRAPDDPIFQLVFPQPGMLSPEAFRTMSDLLAREAPADEVESAARRIRRTLNPHPAEQMELNVPYHDGRPLHGVQHKYRETVLVFPAQGQTCHAYCTFCFRWPQFVGHDDEVKFAITHAEDVVSYVARHREISDVLLTGGDPLVMKTAVLARYIEPLLAPFMSHVTAIRIGTKAPAYWPYRFLDDPEADDLLALFERVVESGRTLALMVQYTHPRELETKAAQRALERILRTGAVVRCQAPVIRRVNDDPDVWRDLWNLEARLGAIPYYAFVERDTGPRDWFALPLVRAWEIIRGARSRVSGIARTAQGPTMSTSAGKIVIDGPAMAGSDRVLALRFLQGRNPEWVGRPFFARFHSRSTWLDDLRPAFGEREFFFEPEMHRLRRLRAREQGVVIDLRRRREGEPAA